MNTRDLTNRAIAENFKAHAFCLMPSDFIGAFAYWAAAQSTGRPIHVDRPIIAYRGYIMQFFTNPQVPQFFSLAELEVINSENILASIPEIYELSEGRNYIDLVALSRNVTYMICRKSLIENDNL